MGPGLNGHRVAGFVEIEIDGKGICGKLFGDDQGE